MVLWDGRTVQDFLVSPTWRDANRGCDKKITRPAASGHAGERPRRGAEDNYYRGSSAVAIVHTIMNEIQHKVRCYHSPPGLSHSRNHMPTDLME